MSSEIRYRTIRVKGNEWKTISVMRGKVTEEVFNNSYFETKELSLENFTNQINKENKDLNLLLFNLSKEKGLPIGDILKKDMLFHLGAARKVMSKVCNSEKYPMNQRVYLRKQRTLLSEIRNNLRFKNLMSMEYAELIKFRKYYGGDKR